MSSNVAKARSSEERPTPPIEVVVWVFFGIALAASLYFLLREPEDVARSVLDHSMVQARMLALAASVLGAAPGLWRILTRGGEPRENLFAMAVLFNLVLACFWALRYAFEAQALAGS